MLNYIALTGYYMDLRGLISWANPVLNMSEKQDIIIFLISFFPICVMWCMYIWYVCIVCDTCMWVNRCTFSYAWKEWMKKQLEIQIRCHPMLISTIEGALKQGLLLNAEWEVTVFSWVGWPGSLASSCLYPQCGVTSIHSQVQLVIHSSPPLVLSLSMYFYHIQLHLLLNPTRSIFPLPNFRSSFVAFVSNPSTPIWVVYLPLAPSLL